MLSMGNVRLEPHPTARNKAVAAIPLHAGALIVSVKSLSTVLLLSQKRYRCDACLRLPSRNTSLKKCTGCASYWYCDAQCQKLHWEAHHKKICKVYNTFISSSTFEALAAHEKMDALLLTHLLAEISPATLPSSDDSSPTAIFYSLLPGPQINHTTPPVPHYNISTPAGTIKDIYSRFGNNNFTIHSHLNSIGHGVFPLASRLFNHSCSPNAAARYVFSHATPVTMEVVALRDITGDEEICLPYLDPALTQLRQQIFNLTYGFTCSCSSCRSIENLGDITPPPKSPLELEILADTLRRYVGIDERLNSRLQSMPQQDVPDSLRAVFHESYLSDLSEIFSKASHESQYGIALDSGVTLLALYVLFYPVNYPQIGMHLVELAKTAWNKLVSSLDGTQEIELAIKAQVQTFLSRGREVLAVFGPEGDEDGPLQEIEVLQSLLDSWQRSGDH